MKLMSNTSPAPVVFAASIGRPGTSMMVSPFTETAPSAPRLITVWRAREPIAATPSSHVDVPVRWQSSSWFGMKRSTWSRSASVSSRVCVCHPPGSQLGSKTTNWPRWRRPRAYPVTSPGENWGSRKFPQRKTSAQAAIRSSCRSATATLICSWAPSTVRMLRCPQSPTKTMPRQVAASRIVATPAVSIRAAISSRRKNAALASSPTVDTTNGDIPKPRPANARYPAVPASSTREDSTMSSSSHSGNRVTVETTWSTLRLPTMAIGRWNSNDIEYDHRVQVAGPVGIQPHGQRTVVAQQLRERQIEQAAREIAEAGSDDEAVIDAAWLVGSDRNHVRAVLLEITLDIGDVRVLASSLEENDQRLLIDDRNRAMPELEWIVGFARALRHFLELERALLGQSLIGAKPEINGLVIRFQRADLPGHVVHRLKLIIECGRQPLQFVEHHIVLRDQRRDHLQGKQHGGERLGHHDRLFDREGELNAEFATLYQLRATGAGNPDCCDARVMFAQVAGGQ